MSSEFKVLVVEDNTDDFVMLQRSLRLVSTFDLIREDSAASGLARLKQQPFDVVLLDLTLPDSKGQESVIAFTELATTPVVVLSGIDDENAALESVQHGAHDYLVKGKFDKTLIIRTLRYAIERFRLVEQLRDTQQQVRRERELGRLGSEVASPSGGVTPDESASNLLKTTQAPFFKHVTAEYCDLIDKALELRDFKTEYDVTARLKALASDLGARSASPRDVVDVHTSSLNTKLASMSARRSALCNEEARYLLTGLLGHLCLYYRSRYAAAASGSRTGNHEGVESSFNLGLVGEEG